VLDHPLVQAIILGIVQGLTEFLPVSSSGHLVVVPYILGWRAPGLEFNVALHAGTLVAVVAYFAGDLWYLATRSIGIGVVEDGEASRARRVVLLLAIGTVPAAALGLLIGGRLEAVFEQPVWVAGFFLVTATLLTTAEMVRRRRARAATDAGADVPAEHDPGRDESTIGFGDVVAIGCAQALALFPGISRSGSTIAAGMYVGLSREASARFSFLLAIPIIAGAALTEVPDLLRVDTSAMFSSTEVLAGMLAATISGFWAIRFLLRLVQTDELVGFARYLVIISAVTFVGRLWIGPPGAI
jgi:undecaprenyl-diphosphatase